ncbi:MAG: LamG domain-containing protein [Phycisphaerales bacterium]|nr:MAG: LamG domain-containing protein [Phycisphaerales bacterium]
MEPKRRILMGVVLATLCLGSFVDARDMQAYYTKINSGQEFERYSRTGPYADIVVKLEEGKFVFWRGSSYLPYWETSQGKWFVGELFERQGDGPSERPDKVNTYSRVIIAESEPDRVLVYWRYLPKFGGKNPHVGVDATKFVEEYFDLASDGTVMRTVREGTPRIDAWRDPSNKTVQTFTLTAQGISEKSLKRPTISSSVSAVAGSPVKKGFVVTPVRYWRFDDARGDVTTEGVTGYQSTIAGHKSLWKVGVSGTALQFDGYNSEVTLPAAQAPKITDAITLEGWVAIGAYPWNWTPIVQQCDDAPEGMESVRADDEEEDEEDEEEDKQEEFEDEDEPDLEAIAFEDLPEAVCRVARQEYPNEPLMAVEREQRDDQLYYHVMFEVDGIEAGLLMNASGSVLDRWHFDEEEEDEDEEEDGPQFEFVLKPERDTGYFLGIDGLGHVGLKLRVGDDWRELVSERPLERHRWYHVAGTYDGKTGEMRLYIDGKSSAEKLLLPERIVVSKKDIRIGRGKPRRPIRPVRANTFVDTYGFDGLIDEVRIYDTALTESQVRQSSYRLRPARAVVTRPDMDDRILPTGEKRGQFGAYYTHLKFYETWDNLWRFGAYPDVVVEFDESPCKFVFWRGMGYIPMLVNERGHWYSNEFNETWGRSGGQGCQEPMSDKESYTNHARIIENTPARVVVQWRYPLVDVFHVIANYDDNTGWGDWSDWYYTIYPDGVAVKKMHLWTHGPRNHEWQEGMAILGPDQHPEQILETEPALLLADMDGNVSAYNWSNGPPRGVSYENKAIHIVNYQADYDPFTVADFEGGDVYSGEVTDYAVFPSWNHWPVAQMPSDGRYAAYPDRTAHSSLTHIDWPTYREDYGDRPFYQKLMLEGMSNESPGALGTLANSWFHAPRPQNVKGATDAAYDRPQRAYVMTASDAEISFQLAASPQSPLLNPAFVIKHWKKKGDAQVRLNRTNLQAGSSFRQGTTYDTDGQPQKILWLKLEAKEPVRLSIE